MARPKSDESKEYERYVTRTLMFMLKTQNPDLTNGQIEEDLELGDGTGSSFSRYASGARALSIDRCGTVFQRASKNIKRRSLDKSRPAAQLRRRNLQFGFEELLSRHNLLEASASDRLQKTFVLVEKYMSEAREIQVLIKKLNSTIEEMSDASIDLVLDTEYPLGYPAEYQSAGDWLLGQKVVLELPVAIPHWLPNLAPKTGAKVVQLDPKLKRNEKKSNAKKSNEIKALKVK
jgi:hypothetical protein